MLPRGRSNEGMSIQFELFGATYFSTTVPGITIFKAGPTRFIIDIAGNDECHSEPSLGEAIAWAERTFLIATF